MTDEERVQAILATTRLRNVPVAGEPGMRLVGFVVSEDVADLSQGLFAIGEIQRRAIAASK